MILIVFYDFAVGMILEVGYVEILIIVFDFGIIILISGDYEFMFGVTLIIDFFVGR